MDRKFPALMDKNFRLGRESLWNENNQNRNKKARTDLVVVMHHREALLFYPSLLTPFFCIVVDTA
ncbi:hypothetical protein BI375_06055 [Vibrio rotiferianus]|jgi:hypothetical protein|uniref:Uncharacterized protein n=1 Tax=Vibrio rotiferianus TaxID=190895 RepID=A0ABX3D8B2_9VIBR|nr:hypothetical protein BI375_06055 [Vibrio rotiferianus]